MRSIGRLLVAVLVASSGAAAGAHENTSPVDSASGTGIVIADPLKPERIGGALSFSVRRSRGMLSGWVQFRPGSATLDAAAAWDGRPTCLFMDNKLAIVGGTMRRPGSGVVIGRFALLVRNTIDMDYGEDPALLRYGTNLSGACSTNEFVMRLPLAYASVSGRVHDGSNTPITQDIG